jgi:hypothetical protein
VGLEEPEALRDRMKLRHVPALPKITVALLRGPELQRRTTRLLPRVRVPRITTVREPGTIGEWPRALVLQRTIHRLLRVLELRTTGQEPTTIAEFRVRVLRTITIIPLPPRALELQKTSQARATIVEFRGRVLPKTTAIYRLALADPITEPERHSARTRRHDQALRTITVETRRVRRPPRIVRLSRKTDRPRRTIAQFNRTIGRVNRLRRLRRDPRHGVNLLLVRKPVQLNRRLSRKRDQHSRGMKGQAIHRRAMRERTRTKSRRNIAEYRSSFLASPDDRTGLFFCRNADEWFESRLAALSS